MAEGEEKWKARAKMIKEGKAKGTFEILEERGFIKDTAG